MKAVLLDQPLRFVQKEDDCSGEGSDGEEDGDDEEEDDDDGGCCNCGKMRCVRVKDDSEKRPVEVMYNRRKMMQLPRQLVTAERHDDVIKEVALNFDWLLAKTQAFSLRHVVQDLRMVAHPEVRVLEEAMLFAFEHIDDDVSNMAYELTRLLLMFRRELRGVRGFIDSMDRRTRGLLVGMPQWRRRVGALEGEVDVGVVVDDVVEVCIGGRRMLMMKEEEGQQVVVVDASNMTTTASLSVSRGHLYATPNGLKCLVHDDFGEVTLNLYDVSNGCFLGHVFPLHGISPSENAVVKSVNLSNSRMTYVVEGSCSWLSVRLLDAPNFDEVVHLALQARPTLLALSLDQSHVITAFDVTLIACNLNTNQPISMALPCTGHLCCTDASSSVLFVACQVPDSCVCGQTIENYLTNKPKISERFIN